ncbi:MAG: serine hydrolase [Lachnospiraceae bacterium]|nr:serine hydrolase [Lachnospiraceae bacterium]
MKKNAASSSIIKYLCTLLMLLLLVLCFSVPTHAASSVSVKNIQTVSGGSFVKEDGQWYYIYADGTRAKNCLLEIDGKTYYFAKNGRRKSGWQTIGNAQYYFGKKSEGYMYKKCWYTSASGETYRLANNGKMRTGLITVGSKTYYLDPETGVLQYGWQKVNGVRCYFGSSDESGAMYQNKWLTYDGSLYYLTADGSRATGWQTIDGKTYYFSSSGKACRSKKTISGTTYYFSSTTGELLYSGANLSVSCDCAVLINASTGEVLYDKNGSAQHSNASTTKIMTCILALENSSLTDKVTASANAAAQEPTKIYLHTGEVFYMKDLLYGLMLPSGNDAAVAIAEHISGSTSAFADLMNQKAKEIGCTSTHFVTPNGLDAGYDHYTTAEDLAKIAQYAYQNATFRTIVATKTYSFKSVSGYSYYLTSTNSLLGTMTGVTGMKTGYTKKAGYCFVGSITSQSGDAYIAVVLGASTSSARWSDAKTLLNYAYNLS